jgi:hypothetical protein
MQLRTTITQRMSAAAIRTNWGPSKRERSLGKTFANSKFMT